MLIYLYLYIHIYTIAKRECRKVPFICYFIYIENKQHHHMCVSWRKRFVVCR